MSTWGWVEGHAGDLGNERADIWRGIGEAAAMVRFAPGNLSGACVIRNAARR